MELATIDLYLTVSRLFSPNSDFSMVLSNTEEDDWKAYHEFFAGFPKGKGLDVLVTSKKKVKRGRVKSRFT